MNAATGTASAATGTGYEARMTDASGNPITVYVNDAFAVVGTGRHLSEPT